MVKAIQVGLGGWGFNWAEEVLPEVKAVEPLAFVDAAPAALERVQQKLDVPKSQCFATLAEAAKATDAELVIATLRTDAHHPVVMEALSLGKHVIVEKPFASTIRQAQEMVALAEQQKRVLMVSQNYRFQSAPQMVTDLVEQKALGTVNLVSIDFRRHAPTQGYRYWDMPDPLLADMSIHHFDLMRMVLGSDPKRVSCRTWNAPGNPFVYHPIGVATIEFEDGVIVSYRGSWVSGGENTAWAGEWTLDCNEGEIWWTSRDHVDDGPSRPDRVIVKPREEEPEIHKLAHLRYEDRAGTLNAVANTIATGTPPAHFSSGRDNLMSLALVQACITSAARQGDWVEIAEVLG